MAVLITFKCLAIISLPVSLIITEIGAKASISVDHILFRVNSHIYVIVHDRSNCPAPIWEYNRALLKWYDGLSIIKKITIDFATPITFDFFPPAASFFLHIKHGLMPFFNSYRLWLSHSLRCSARINKCNYKRDGSIWSSLNYSMYACLII